MAGLNMAFLGNLPGNVMEGNVRLLVIVDDKATDAQQESLLAAFTGKEGGPLADLAGLVGEVVAVERAAIEFDVNEGSGTFRVGGRFEGEVQGQRSSCGMWRPWCDTPRDRHDRGRCVRSRPARSRFMGLCRHAAPARPTRPTPAIIDQPGLSPGEPSLHQTRGGSDPLKRAGDGGCRIRTPQSSGQG